MTGDALRDTERPGASNDAYRPYVPVVVRRWLVDAPAVTHRRLDGSAVFVDVSGFTKLSERLARVGKLGAEELADIVGACFDRLLRIAWDEGGGLLKFGGDALLLFFEGDDHVTAACRAAVGMRAGLRDLTKAGLRASVGRVQLRMSVGVHTGSFDMFLPVAGHRELVITGPAATTTVAMESTANASEIVVSDAVAAHVPDALLGAAAGDGRFLRRAPASAAHAVAPIGDLVDRDDLDVAVPLAIREHLASGEVEPEHRHATVAFVHFDGTDELIERQGGAVAADAVGELVRVAQRAADAERVTFLATDIDRDGGKIILVAGVPRNVGDGEERMLSAVRRIVEAGTTLPVRIGVNSGRVFAGDIGTTYRRTYTVMGDTVNLAARLMAAAAPGEVLATFGVLERSRTRFATEALEPFTVKGKARPVQAYRVGAARPGQREVAAVVPDLVGRDEELEVLRRALAGLDTRRGSAYEVTGESGCGKSRLLDEAMTLAATITTVRVGCSLYESSVPYAPFRRLLRDVIGIGAADRAEHVRERVRARVEANAPELVAWLPLVGTVLDVDFPSTPETAALDDRFRKEKLEDVVVDLFAVLLPTASVIEIDDVQWMDDASHDLLRRLCLETDEQPWLVITTRTRDPLAAGGDGGAVGDAPTGRFVLTLGPLRRPYAAELVYAVTDDAPLAPHDVDAIVQRSGGNPLLLLRLVDALRASGDIDAVPDSAEAVLTAAIDRLDTPERRLLRYAAVLGSEFSADLLWAVAHDGVAADDLFTRGLASFLTPTDDGRMRFRHALARDAAYETLPFRRRRELHGRIAQVLEVDARGREIESSELLAFHFLQAQHYDKAWHYARVAGDRARDKDAPVEASRFYGWALDVASRVDAPREELAKVCEARGDAFERAGSYDAASAAYRRARKLVAGDPFHCASLLEKEGLLRERGGRYPDALRMLRRAERELDTQTDATADAQRAQLMVSFASVRLRQGRPADAVRWLERTLDAAARVGDRATHAHALYLLDWAAEMRGTAGDPTRSWEALHIYEGLGDVTGQAAVLNNLGAFAYLRGRWGDARDLYERSRDARERTGAAVDAAYGSYNIAEILCDQGHLDDARDLLLATTRVWRAAGDREGVAFAHSLLGLVRARSGDIAGALEYLADARDAFMLLGHDGEIAQVDVRLAECALLDGRLADALELAERTVGVGGPAVDVAALRTIGLALRDQGDDAGARAQLEKSHALALDADEAFQGACTAIVLAPLVAPSGPAAAAALDGAARDLLARFGVVALPAWAPGPVKENAGKTGKS